MTAGSPLLLPSGSTQGQGWKILDGLQCTAVRGVSMVPQATAPLRLQATHDLEIGVVCPAPAGKRASDLTRAAASASKRLSPLFWPREYVDFAVAQPQSQSVHPHVHSKLQTRAGDGRRGPMAGRRGGFPPAHSPRGLCAHATRHGSGWMPLPASVRRGSWRPPLVLS